jgi:hypothetical protein
MHNVDEVLGDLDLNIRTMVRATHWLNPVDPGAYRRLTPSLLWQLAPGPSTSDSPDRPPALLG